MTPAARNVRHTRATAWVTLILATVTSLAGNVYHATRSPAAGWASVVAAAVVPVLLLLGIHLIGGLARARADGRTVAAVYRASVTAVVTLVILVFAASFIALRDVLVVEGAPTWIAVIVPVAVDLAIGVATLALFALKPAAEPVAEPEPVVVVSEPVYPEHTPALHHDALHDDVLHDDAPAPVYPEPATALHTPEPSAPVVRYTDAVPEYTTPSTALHRDAVPEYTALATDAPAEYSVQPPAEYTEPAALHHDVVHEAPAALQTDVVHEEPAAPATDDAPVITASHRAAARKAIAAGGITKTEDAVAEVLARRERGDSIATIAAAMGMNARTVSKILGKAPTLTAA